MFQRLDNRIKQWIVNSVMGIAITLLVLGFFAGQKQNSPNQRDPAETKENESISAEEEAADSTETMKEYDIEDYGNVEVISNTPVKYDELPPEMEELYSNKEITESKVAGEKFVSSFYLYNGKQPMQNIENSKDTVSPTLYQMLAERPERPTSMTIKRELMNIEMIEPFAPSPEVITWKAKVEGIVTNSDYSKRKETDIYTLKLERVNGKYKVTDFLINYLE